MTLTATRSRMFINGDWSDASDGETTSVINPATEETISDVPKGTVADVDRAVAAAERVGRMERLAVARSSALHERQGDVAVHRRAVAHGRDVALAAARLLGVGAGDQMRAVQNGFSVQRLQPHELLPPRVGESRTQR